VLPYFPGEAFLAVGVCVPRIRSTILCAREGRRATTLFSFFGKCCKNKKKLRAAASRVSAVGHSRPKDIVFSISTTRFVKDFVGQFARHASKSSIIIGLICFDFVSRKVVMMGISMFLPVTFAMRL